MSFGSTSLPPPTADELRRWEAIKAHGRCMATDAVCEVEIHHLLSPGGLRLGHRFTVGLEKQAHAIVKTRTFRKHYPDAWLLAKQDKAIGWPAVELPAKRARSQSRCTASAKQHPRNERGFS